MALLGSSVDPRLFIQDYSGFTRAAEIQAKGMQNLGDSISGAIESYADAKEKRKKIDASTKASRAGIESAIKLGDAYGIDIKSSLEPILSKMDDPNTTPMEAAMYGEEAKNQITKVLNMGISATERENAQQRAIAEQQYKMANLGIKDRQASVAEFSAMQATQPKYDTKKVQVTDPNGQIFERELPFNPKSGRYFDPEAGKEILDVQKWYEGNPSYAPDESTSQVMPSDGAFGFTYKTRDLLPASSPNNRQISLDFNAAPSKNARGIEIIIPNNATDGERQLAREYVEKTQQYFAEHGVIVPVRGIRTAKENGRGTPNRFHTEPFFVGDAASRAVMEKDPDGYAQVLASTLGRIPGAMFIPPHKSNDPGAADGKFNERDFAKGSIIPALERLSQQKSAQASPTGIDNALAMGDDMTQQAMGTPQQQAELIRMSVEGASSATAQNMPQDAVPTEASLTNQQVQPAQPQFRPRSGFVPVKAQGGKPTTMMTAEQIRNLEQQGFKVSAVPNSDGTFMVSGVTTGGGSKGIEVKTADGTTITYGGSGGLAQPKVGLGQQLVPDPTSPTGTRIENIPGGEAEKAAEKVKSSAESERRRTLELATTALGEIDNFIAYTDKMSKLPFASPIRKVFANIGMEEQAEAESSLATVQANLKFEALQALRLASPTGSSGLGQVTKPEFEDLANQWGTLRLVGDPAKIKERALNMKKHLLNIVHGNKAHRDALLKKGVISQQQYDEIQAQYPGAAQAAPQDANIQRWRKSFGAQPTQ